MELRIDIKDEGIDRALARLAAKGRNMKGALAVIGERVLRQTDDRWARNIDPDGRPWKSPLSATWRKKKTSLTLQESGHLRGSIRYQVTGNTLLVGTDVPYARIHHAGGKTAAHIIRPKQGKALFWPGAGHPVKAVRHPGSDMPARPFLGIGRTDALDIQEVLTDWLEEATR